MEHTTDKNKHTMHTKTVIGVYHIETYVNHVARRNSTEKKREISMYVTHMNNRNKILASIVNIPTDKSIYELAKELIHLHEKRTVDKFL